MIGGERRLDALSETERRALLARLLRERAARSQTFPASFAQQRLWFVCQLDPATGAYNIPAAVRLTGRLDVAALTAAFEEVMRRHEALRTTFALADGRPVQVVHPGLRLRLPVVELSGLSGSPAAAPERRRLVLDESSLAFDLTAGPLLRVCLIRLGASEHLLLLTMHHLVSDGWSMGVVVREIAALYRAFAAGEAPSLPELPIQYADFAKWQRDWLGRGEMERQLAFWREALAGAPPALDLPADRPRPARPTLRGAIRHFALSGSLSAAVADLARREGASLFMTLLAAFYALLFRYTGREDLVVGSPIANRNHSQTEALIGFFANTLVLRARLDPGSGFRVLVERVRTMMLAAYSHQDLPFEKLVEELRPERELSRTPLFQVMFVLQNAPMPPVELPDLVMAPQEVERRTARFDLLLALHEAPEGLRGWFEYSTDLFEQPTMARLARHLEILLAGAVAEPGHPLAELPLLDPAERWAVVAEWNDTGVEYPIHHPGGLCLHQLFEAQAERTPDAVAVVFEETVCTYRELDRRAGILARRLRAVGVGRGRIAAVLFDRSLDMVVALYGVLKAGGAYLPLDPAYPAERLAFILEEAAPRVVLTFRGLAGGLPAAAEVLLLDEDLGDVPGVEVEAPSADDLAYVIYTSGSTGRPKGTMNTHRGIVNRILWMQDAYGLDAGDRVLQKTPYTFDVSVWEFFWPLAFGARLVVARPGGHRDPAYLAELIAREGITTLHFVPSMLRAFVEEGGLDACGGSLRRVIASGEALPPDLAARFLERLDAGLHNLYGPTEAAVDVTAWACRRHWTKPSVPIGRPISNLRVHLLNAAGQPVPVGVPGELLIGGVGVGRGYLGRPDLTADRFVPDPFAAEPGSRLYRTGDLARHLPDGAIEFLGRIDHQVKIRGFRVELGEIEAVLASHPAVAAAAAAVREEGGHPRMVGYVVASNGTPAAGELRRFLESKLPDYMVPAAFVFLDTLPLGATGKLDRRALPAPDPVSAAVEYEPPRTPLEELLTEVWQRVLRLPRVGIHDNFFALGGDSIRSIQVRTGVAERGWTFTLQELLQYQTVHGLARRLEPLGAAAAGVGISAAEPFSLIAEEDRQRVPAGVEDAYSLAALQAGMLFHSQMSAGTALYHDVFSYHLRAPFDEAALAESLRRSMVRHPALRTAIDSASFSEPLQLVHPASEVPVPLAVEDLGDRAPTEQEEAIAAWIEAEKVSSFEWSRPPLWRFHVHRRSAETFQLSLSFHHTILDGWSLASLLTEVFRRYLMLLGRAAGPMDEAPPRLAYRHFVALERETIVSGAAERYWQERLAGSTVATLPRWPGEIPPQPGRPVGMREVPVSGQVSQGVQQLARSLGVPARSVLLAAHLRVVSLLSGQSDVVTGLVGNSRPDGPDAEQVLGLFLNTLPFRVQLRGGTWIDLVRSAFETELDLFPHRRYPIGVLQRRLGGEPLFETAFNFVHYHVYHGLLELREIEALGVEIVEETNLPLMAYVNLNPVSSEIRLVLKYATDRLYPMQVDAMAGFYARALEALAVRPVEPYASASLFSEAERHQLLVEWNDSAAPGLAGGLPRLLETWATRSPEAVAAVCGEDRVTYGELAARVRCRTARLLELGAQPGDVVALLAERGIELLTLMLSVFAMGGAYLPVDPAYPGRRARELVERSGTRLALVSRALAPAFREALADLPGSRQPWIEPLDAPEEHGAAHPPLPGAGEQGLAYVIYTSGSTGVPKGAMVEHAGMLNHLAAKVADLGLTAADVVAQTASQCFDISVWQYLAPLAVGGRVVVLPDEIAHDPERLLDAVEREGVTVLEVVPSLLRPMIAAAYQPSLARLRWLLATGEALPPDLCLLWLSLHPGIPLVNAYGPTECSDDVAHHCIAETPAEETAIVPIGRPVANTRLHVLGPDLTPLPTGVAGELHVGGAGVGRGYLDDGERTAAAFIPDPFGGEPGARLYRTGDLVRRRPDGVLEFLGRSDHQVKVRGFRIELQEVEAVLARHPAVRAGVVVAWASAAAEDRRLVAYVVADVATAELRGFLAERLPEYMVPSAFVHLEALPLTPNGKVDRRALPEPGEVETDTAVEWVAPRTPVEEMLASAFAEVLRQGRVGVRDDFFALGGHSLLATQLVSRVRVAFGVDLPLRALFEAPTVEALSERVEQARRGGVAAPLPPLGPVRRRGPSPLSFAQERLWFIDQLEPGSAAYNLPSTVRIRGELDTRVLAACVEEIVRRHESLRTTFRSDGGQPRQAVHPPRPVPLPLADLGALPEEMRWQAVRRLAQEEAQRPFDITAGPLLRNTLLRLTAREHVLLFTMHHVVSDGWSLGVFIREVAELYPAFAAGRPSPLPELPLQYPDFAVWQREAFAGEALACQLAWWRERLAGSPPVLELFGRRPREARYAGATRWLRLDAALSRQLRALSRREGTTLFMTLLAAFEALLHRYTHQDDVLIGTPVANRTRPEIEGLIGFFVNTLVMRADFAGGPTFRALLGQVRETALSAYANQDLPFEQLVAELNPERDLQRSPLFQVMFVFQNAPLERLELPGLDFELLQIDSETTRFELLLTLLEEGEEIAGTLQFRTDLFEAQVIERLGVHLVALLERIAAEPGARIRELVLLGEAEQHQLAREWNDSRAAYPAGVPFHHLFEAQALRAPDAVAAVYEGEAWSYRELDRRAGLLAARLATEGAGPETLVALLAERGLPLLAAILAVFKAGGAYLPLDPRHPAERHRLILEQGRPALVLAEPRLEETVSEVLAMLPPEERPRWLRLELEEGAPQGSPPQRTGTGSLAYVIFTSGSTGTPKGAMVEQRGMVNHIHAKLAALALTADDVVAQTASQCFDISVWQFLAALAVGGQVRIYPDEISHDPGRLLDRVAQDRVTILETVPSLLRSMLGEAARRSPVRRALPALRWMIPTGEALPPDLCREWAAAYPQIPLLNAYGPTECSDDVTHHAIRSGEGADEIHVPIGRPVINTRLHLLGPALRAVPIGVSGEVYVGGDGVGRGYCNDPLRTAVAFLPDPFGNEPGGRMYRTGDLGRLLPDGTLEFLGRVDHQVKVRGFRIELGEIEAALAAHPAVAEAVVLARESDRGDARLVGYLVAAPGAEIAAQELRRFLKVRLPEHMIPAALVAVAALPLTPNGKLDRDALAALGDGGGVPADAYVAPDTEMEEALAELFAEVIGTERAPRVGIYDNFFDLGGHSLLATRVVSRVRETFEVDLTLRAFFEAPTVAELSAVVERLIIQQIDELSEEEVASSFDLQA